jgi:hypothetical protein
MLQMCLSAFFRGSFSLYVNLILICICIANTIASWQVYITSFTAPQSLGCRGVLIVEYSARRRFLYLTTHNAHKIQTSMPLSGFDRAIPASERPQIHALTRAATRIGVCTALPDVISPNHTENLRKLLCQLCSHFISCCKHW